MYAWHNDTFDTIAAIASPGGKGAISIIRVSGPDTFQLISKIFKPYNKKANIKKQGVYIGRIVHKTIIDEVMVISRTNKKSYTGEDLIEINCHGNPLITNLILDLVIGKGARLAEKGEFTLRAFLNNKIDLIQAEAINDLINASSYSSAELALNNMKGRLSEKIKEIADSFKNSLIQLEVNIDHSDDDTISFNKKQMQKSIDKQKKQIEQLIASYDIGRDIKQGIQITIAGKANAGKSSLFNLLIRREKAIISHIAGTTRDVVEEHIILHNVSLKLIDTAGLKKTVGHIEKEAIKRTQKAIQRANIILVVCDGSKVMDKQDELLFNEVLQTQAHKIVLINKSDLKQNISIKQIKQAFPEQDIIHVSVSRETNIKLIEEKIISYLKKFDLHNKLIINNIRHKSILIQANQHLDHVTKGFKNEYYYDLIAAELRKALNILGQLIGHYSTEDMLTDIFSHFCIGK